MPAEEISDYATSLADARIALCITIGVDLDDIDPARGHDLSRTGYESVRESWRYTVKMHGLDDYLERGLQEAVVWWSERRPEFTEGDDWLVGVEDRSKGSA